MINEGTISPDDQHLVKITDDIDEAVQHIRNFIDKNYKVKYKASWILGEQ
jgi:predicted Rossmann-fold nucleotide-binding protein